MNITFVHCEAYGCKNITSDLYKEKFGAYCFEHSSKCKAPFGSFIKYKSLSPISPRRIVLKETVSLEPKIKKNLDYSPQDTQSSVKSKKHVKVKTKSISPYKSAVKKYKSLILPLPDEVQNEFEEIKNDLIPVTPEDKPESIYLPLPDEEQEKITYISPGMDLTFENYESSPVIVQSIKTSVPSPRKNSKFVKKIHCCYCTDSYDIAKVMNCGHMICPQCLEGIVRSPYCEFCGKILEGPFLNEKLSMIINNKYKQDLENLSNEYEESSEEESEEE